MTINARNFYRDVMKTQTNKIARLLNRDIDVDENLLNISSYKLTFFEKLVLCRGLKFSLPQFVQPIEVKASFEKPYCKIEPVIADDLKELTAASLKSIALNYIQGKDSKPPKMLKEAINSLKKRNDIIITKPDKGSGVVVMNKDEYSRLLRKASVDDKNKFKEVSAERPKTRVRPPKYYHPLLQKEKALSLAVHKILPSAIANAVCIKGSHLAHLYGLPKTHKKQLSVRRILSATSTYNYALAKWLEDKLKPVSYNRYSILDIFEFAEEIRAKGINEDDIVVSYDVASLFTDVPLDETIGILVNKAFKDNWFNSQYNLNISRQDLTDLLNIATNDQLFQFEGTLYEQFDGVAIGCPLWPLIANVFICSIEEN